MKVFKAIQTIISYINSIYSNLLNSEKFFYQTKYKINTK
jgi:hypothetical protein